MAVSSVLAPNGKTYTFEHPDGASQEDLFRFVHQSSQVKPKAQATKPGVVENVARSIPAGAAAAGYDVLGAIGTMALEGLGKYAKAKSDPEYAEKMDQAIRGAQETVSEYTFDIGATANESFGVDQGRFSADVGGGLGQLPVMVLTGGLASVPMSFAEVIKDAEQSLDVKYYDMTEDQKAKVAATGGAYAAFSLAADRIGLKYMGLTKLNKFFDGSETVKGSIVKDALKGTLGEGLTETSQAVVQDQLARVYDDDREYNIDSVKGYLYEGAVGATVGGIASTGTSVVKNIGSETSGTKKADLKKPVEERSEITMPDEVTVTYKPIDGPVKTVSLAIDPGQDVASAVEEELAGRYDTTYPMTIDQAPAPVPVGSEQTFDLPNQAPDPTQEQVPVQPEAAVEQVPEAAVPTPEQAPVEQVLPEVVPQVVPATEQAPEAAVDEGIGPYDNSELTEPNSTTGNVKTLNEIFDLGKKSWENTSGDPRRAQGTSNTIGKNFGEKAKEAHMRGWKSSMEAELKERQARKAPTPEARSFSLPQNLKKGKPGYRQTQNVKFASDLERAAYSATTSTRSEPGKRKREQYRARLQKAGYSSAEINEMGREVRSQMRDQYDVPGSELSVDLNKNRLLPSDFEDDITADAANGLEVQRQVQFDDNEALNALPKKEKAKFNRHKDKPIERGAVRLNLGSAFSKEGVPGKLFVQTLHPIKRTGTPNYGKAHSYGRAFTLRNATFSVNPFAKTIIRSKAENKYPMASVDGDVVTDAEPNLEGEVLSFNPFANDSFVDSQGRVVTGADEVTVYGTKAYARGNIQYAEESPEVVTASEILSLAKQGKKYVHPKFHPKGIDLSKLNETQIKKLEALSAQESNIENQLQNEKENTQEQPGTGAISAPAGNRLFSQPLQDATSVSERYQRTQGIRGQEPRQVVELDEERAAVIGKAYDKMKHDPKNPEVVRAYKALVEETLAQYDAILEEGYVMELSDSEYDNSKDMIEDVRNRKVMRVFSTEDGFGSKGISAKERRENPMLADSGRTDKNGKPLLVNDIFRFVHDFFGHGKLGNGFGPLGEENAWNVHSLMFSPLARRALTTETRGQNSWVNFSGVNDKVFEIRDQARKARADGDLKKAKRLAQKAYSSMQFAEQKIGLLPQEFAESDYQEDVTAQAAQPEVEDRGPRDTYDNGGQVQDAIEKEFNPIGDKISTPIVMRMGKTDYVARYNATRGIIEYNPMLLLKRSKAGVRAAMREEIIHAAMHQVLMVSARKKFSMAEGGKVWTDFFDAFGQSLTDAERSDIKDVYQSLDPEDYVGHGSEYSRAVIQNLLYGEFSEQYQMESQGGPAWNAIVKLLRSVQAYMAKVLGPMIKTNPEAAQVIVDSVELLKAADPSIRPKSQDVVAKAYDATDKNTAKENTEAGETVGKDSSERIREERKWFDGAFRKTASKYLTPVITRLNRINPMFGRILQNLDTAIRTRSFQYRKQTEMFFNRLNAVKGAEFQELKQLIFFSPTPEEANLPSNKAKMQRRDALLHKHGLLNMYRLDVQPILEEIYTEYNALGMPKIGYLEDYFPRVIKDLEGLIKSYGHKTKRTFEMLVNEENIRRSEMKDADGNPAPLPEMQETERARFFQDFLQGKFRLDLNGVKLPGNVKAREIQLIPEDKLKFYDDPGVAFGKYTTNMARAIESFKVVGDTKKGEGRLLGSLGQLTEELFAAGQIDQADASELKTLTELITSQFQAENQILKSLGTLTYMATLINPGPVLVQIMDLYKVALYRGLGGVVSGTYRTVTGNRRFDIERDFSIAKTQLSAEFEDPSFLTKALDFGLSRLVPFRQMDTAMKHASIEAAYDDFVKKAKAPVGSKKHQQLIDYLTIKMGPEGARKAISDLKLDRAAESTEIKEALLSELLERQPMTYLQVPEGYQTDPSKRLFYKLSTFMLLDLNYNRQEFMNDLGGPGKTLKQRTVALRRLAYMATLLTMFGLPSDLLDDWIAGKDTYIPEHVMNNMLGMFGLSKYTTTRALEKGAVESVIQRFTPPAINIMIDGEQSLRSWVKGDKELFDIKAWRYSPLSDAWFYKTGAGAESQRKYQKKQKKEGITPTFDR